jgi:hypothetical protein
MRIYSFDKFTGEYTGDTTAVANPAFGEEGQPEFLFPAQTTLTPPPNTAANQTACFVSGNWEVLPDHRGEIGYTLDGAEVQITELGKTIEGLNLQRTRPITAQAIRAERDTKLMVSDWTQLSDVPQAVKDKYTTYRQALRDVPSQAGFPSNVTWPTKPE